MTQKPLIFITAFFCLSIAGLTTTSAEKIYKWTDSKGNMHYSDRPHDSHPTEKIKIGSGPSDQAVQDAKQLEQQLKSTAESLEQQNQQRDQARIEAKKT